MGEEHRPREGEDFTQILAELETPGRFGDARSYNMGRMN
eukprot:symbB.v1.2.040609.t1/scaffold7374.1/size11636/2